MQYPRASNGRSVTIPRVEVLLSLGPKGGVEGKVSRTQKEKVLRGTGFFG